MPGALLLFVRIYPKGHPRRAELVAELYVRPFHAKLLFVVQSLELSFAEGIAARWSARQQRRSVDRTDNTVGSVVVHLDSHGTPLRQVFVSTSADDHVYWRELLGALSPGEILQIVDEDGCRLPTRLLPPDEREL